VTASPGGAQASGSGSPIVVTGLTNGTSYSFTVTATNAAGTGAASADSNAVTPSGGGGGGGGGTPNTKATVSVPNPPHNAGDAYAYAISLVNNGGSSSNTTLTVTLPAQTSYNVSVVDRGPGCTSSGQTVTCSLDFFPAGQQSTVIVGARVSSVGTLVMTTSVSSSPGELNTTDGSVTNTLTVGSSTSPGTPGPSPVTKPPTPSAPSFASLVLFALKPVLLPLRTPSLQVKVKASKQTELTLTLVDRTGKKLVTWRVHAKAGVNTLTLVLPARARKAGNATLEVHAAGSPSVGKLRVTLLA